MKQFAIQRARLEDVEAMKAILDDFARSGDLLARSRLSLYETIRDFFVAKDAGGAVIGLSALHISWIDLAEVRSLAVKRELQGQGIGRALVERCVADAEELGLRRVFALTYRPEFFGMLGFHGIEKSALPHKVWQDCVQCVKFPDCDEVAVMRDLSATRGPGERPAAAP